MNKKFPCHLPSSKEDAIVVASQATDHLIVQKKTRFPEKSGPSTRLKPATSKHLRMPTPIMKPVPDRKHKEAVMLLNGQESILDSTKPAQAMRTCILLDNESSATIFCNPEMVTNI